jgi:hypothetical protein
MLAFAYGRRLASSSALRPVTQLQLVSCRLQRLEGRMMSSASSPTEPSTAAQNWIAWAQTQSVQKTPPPLTFPWLVETPDRRPVPYPFRATAAFWWLRFLPGSFFRLVSRSLVISYLYQVTGSDYFPDQFLKGVRFATDQFLKAVSTQNEGALKRCLTEPLYNAIHKDLEVARQTGYKLEVEAPRVYDAFVRDAWLWVGRESAFENDLPRAINSNEIGEFGTMSFGYVRAPGAESGHSMAQKTLREGAKFRVDVAVDLELNWRVNKIKHDAGDTESVSDATNTTVSDGAVRRTMVLSFDTPWFHPSSSMVEGWNKNSQVSDWQWHLGDIDHLLRDEALRLRERKLGLTSANDESSK